jgi:hypothetical protein
MDHAANLLRHEPVNYTRKIVYKIGLWLGRRKKIFSLSFKQINNFHFFLLQAATDTIMFTSVVS